MQSICRRALCIIMPALLFSLPGVAARNGSVAPMEGAVKVYTLPQDFQRKVGGSYNLQWLGENRLEITDLSGRQTEKSYTVNIKTGQKSQIRTSRVKTITEGEDATMRRRWHLPDDGDMANPMGFSSHHTFIFAAAPGGWRTIQEPIDLYEKKGDMYGTLVSGKLL